MSQILLPALKRFQRSRNTCLVMATLGLAASDSLGSASAQDYPLLFATFGDMPYAAPVPTYANRAKPGVLETDKNVLEWFIYPTLKSDHKIPFVIHLGDTGRPEDVCDPQTFIEGVGAWNNTIKSVPPLIGKPVFYTPGDNDWTDCWRDPVKPVDPMSALRNIRSNAFYGTHGWQRQVALGVGDWSKVEGLQPTVYLGDLFNFPNYSENWMWTYAPFLYEPVLFATVHEVGSNNGSVPKNPVREEEERERTANNLTWLKYIESSVSKVKPKAVVIAMHVDPFAVPGGGECKPIYKSVCDRLKGFGQRMQAKNVPVLLVHGDTYAHCLDQPMGEDSLWRLNAPGDYHVIDADVVKLGPIKDQPFIVKGLLSGLAPPNKCDVRYPVETNQLGALIRQNNNGDCNNGSVIASSDKGNISGFVSVTLNESQSEGPYYAVKVRLNNTGLIPGNTVDFNLKCKRTLGTMTVGKGGALSDEFFFSANEVGEEFAFDMYPSGQPRGFIFQSEQMKRMSVAQ